MYRAASSKSTLWQTGFDVRLIFAGILFCSADMTLAQTSLDIFYEMSLEELTKINITVRKRNEQIQQIPASVIAFDKHSINYSFLDNPQDVIWATPGLISNHDNMLEPNIFMRGAGTDIDSASSNASVGYFADQVYQPRAMAYSMLYHDIQRIEILRGPQGTLYGKNVVGGLVNVVTNKPSNKQMTMLKASIGNYNTINLQGVANIPLTDTTALRVSAASQAHQGYAKNTHTDNDMEDLSFSSLRTQFSYSPSSQISMLIGVDSSRRRGTGQWIDIKIPSENNIPFKNADERRGPNNIDGDTESEVDGGSLHLSYTLEHWSVTSITALRQGDFKHYNNDAGSFVDITLIPLDTSTGRVDFLSDDYDPSSFSDTLFINRKTENVTMASQEVTAESKFQGALNTMVGFFIMSEDIDRLENPNYLFGQFVTQGSETSRTRSDNETIGIFGELSYRYRDAIEATLGLRYTLDKKDFSVYRKYTGDPLSRSFVDQQGNPTTLFSAKDKDSWNALTPSFVLSWEVTDTLLLYLLNSKGFKSGGWNGENATSPQEAIVSYDEEFADNVEIGLKSSLFNRRAHLNATLFSTDYDDLQTQQFQVFAEGISADNVITNASRARVEGLELDFSAQFSSRWAVAGSYAYMDANIADDLINTELNFDSDCLCSVPVDVNLKGNTLRRSPRNSLNIATKLNLWQGGAGSLQLLMQYNYTGTYHLDNTNSWRTKVDRFEIFDASVRLAPNHNQWEIKGWVKNLTDERVVNWVIDVIGSVLVSYAPPRTAGITLSYRM